MGWEVGIRKRELFNTSIDVGKYWTKTRSREFNNKSKLCEIKTGGQTDRQTEASLGCISTEHGYGWLTIKSHPKPGSVEMHPKDTNIFFILGLPAIANTKVMTNFIFPIFVDLLGEFCFNFVFSKRLLIILFAMKLKNEVIEVFCLNSNGLASDWIGLALNKTRITNEILQLPIEICIIEAVASLDYVSF